MSRLVSSPNLGIPTDEDCRQLEVGGGGGNILAHDSRAFRRLVSTFKLGNQFVPHLHPVSKRKIVNSTGTQYYVVTICSSHLPSLVEEGRVD